MSKILARCGSGVLADEGERWIFGHQTGSGGNTFVFVLGLIGTIATINGIVFTAQWATFGAAGPIFFLVGVLALAATFAFVRRRNRRRTSASIDPLVIIDFPSGMLLDASGRELAPLADVQFTSRMQLASSASALLCRWPAGDRVVLRGDAFGGRIGPALDALRSRGLRA